MTDHPLNQTAEITEEMDQVAAVAFHSALHGSSGINAPSNYVIAARAALSAALAVAPTDPRPWEPLNGRAPRVGEEIRRDRYGITSIAVVGRVDRTGDPWTAEGALIGMLKHGTWYVRRPVQELPTEDGAVIVPAEGCEFIGGQGVRLFTRLTYSGQLGLWYGVTVNGGPAWSALWYGEPEKIDPDTWKVAGQ